MIKQYPTEVDVPNFDVFYFIFRMKISIPLYFSYNRDMCPNLYEYGVFCVDKHIAIFFLHNFRFQHLKLKIETKTKMATYIKS